MSTLAANLRVRLSREELHQLRWLLGLVLVLLAFWTLFGLEFGGLVWRTLFLVTAASALAFPGWPGLIPGWIRRWSLILGAAALFSQFIATQFDIISGLVLMVSLLALSRGLQYRRLREDWQLVLLCLFIIILVGVLTLSLLFGLQILAFTVVTMALLFVMNLLQRDAGRELTREDWKNFHWLRFLRRVRHALDLRQLVQAAGLFSALVLVSTLIFISMPRYQFEQSFSFPSMRGVSGFRGDVQYSEERGIDNDDSVAFRVDVPPGVSFSSKPYWRMIILDDYRDNGFHLSPGLQPFHFGQTQVVRYPANGTNQEDRTRLGDLTWVDGPWKFYMEGNISEYLPVIGPFDSLTFSTAQSFRADERVKIYRTETTSPKAFGYEIDNMDRGDSFPASRTEKFPGYAANFTLATADATRKGGTVPLDYPLSYFTLPKTPGDRAILDDLRDQILDRAALTRGGDRKSVTREEYLNAVITYLQQNHVASMEMNLKGTEANGHDLLIRWLHTKGSKGWCEFYAGAFVLLARAAGYPTRMVNGYRGASLNTIENYYVVRQSLAHAWAEVFDGKDRWIRYDPTPGGQNPLLGQLPDQNGGGGPALESGMGAFFDSLRMIWYRRVINFDQADQEEMAATVSEYGKSFVAAIGQWFTDRWNQIKDWFHGPLTPLRAEALAMSALLAVLGWLWRGRLRNLWLRWGGRILLGHAHRLPPVRIDAGRWLRRFQPVWQAHARMLPVPERAQWETVRRNLLALRYGPLDQPPDPAGTFQQAKKLLRAARQTSRSEV